MQLVMQDYLYTRYRGVLFVKGRFEAFGYLVQQIPWRAVNSWSDELYSDCVN